MRLTHGLEERCGIQMESVSIFINAPNTGTWVFSNYIPWKALNRCADMLLSHVQKICGSPVYDSATQLILIVEFNSGRVVNAKQ